MLGLVIGLVALAVIAWASAWQTMNWLGDAEEVIERSAVQLESGYELTAHVELGGWKRRTPRRG